MRLTLRVVERRIKAGYVYYRVNIPKDVSDKLELKSGSRLLIEILEVMNPEEVIDA